MLSPLSNRTYRHLFLAQVLSLLGTGLATVALGLLAAALLLVRRVVTAAPAGSGDRRSAART